jgi:16S rRNA (uracil1498-N3)-methyltransferase
VHRFFAPSIDPGDELVVLPRDEAEHLTRVLRLGAGDTIAVFDGRGHEYLGRVVSAMRRDATVAILQRIEPVREPVVQITVAQAVLKGDRMDDVVRDAVMLGAAAIQPIVTARAESTVAALTRGGRVDRWQRVALASAKQSQRAVLPEICRPLTLAAYLDDPRPGTTLMLVEPSSGAAATSIRLLQDIPRPSHAGILVGPEGGWAEPEWQSAAASGVHLVTLGHRTLRADAVAIAALSILDFIWGDI